MVHSDSTCLSAIMIHFSVAFPHGDIIAQIVVLAQGVEPRPAGCKPVALPLSYASWILREQFPVRESNSHLQTENLLFFR